MRNRWLALGALVVLVSACDGSLDRARQGLRIGYAVEAPYAFLEADGTVTGEAPATAVEVARRLGLGPITWRQMEFGRLLDELESGRIDLVAAGTFITPERLSRVAFSVPTFQVREALLVPRGNPRGLHTFVAPANPPNLVILDGAVEEAFLTRLGWPPSSLRQAPDLRTALAILSDHRAEGLVLSSPTLRAVALEHPEFEVVSDPDNERNPASRGAFAFRKADQALLNAWNRELKAFLATDEHRALVAPLGFGPEEAP